MDLDYVGQLTRPLPTRDAALENTGAPLLARH